MNNKNLVKVESIKFLGTTIDCNLSWKPHVRQLCTKISQLTGVLYKIRNSITTDCMKLIYMSTVYPQLLYCSAIWGGAYKTVLDNLFVSQKKVIRIMFFKSKYDHTDPLFADNRLLKVPDIISLQTCIFVFKCLHIYPSVTTYELLSNNPDSRRPYDLRVPLCHTVQAQRGVSVRGVRAWNALPHHAKSSTSVLILKSTIKSSLFNTDNNQS